MSRESSDTSKSPVQTLTLDGEEWRPISDWEGLYSVSDFGRVRSESRVVFRAGSKGDLPVRARVLAPVPNPKTGYITVCLCRDSRPRVFHVHALVMRTFVGPRPEGLVIRHLDGDQANNAVSNLVYGTTSENELDKVRHGTHNFASRTHCPRGHALVVPNLVPSAAKKGCRTCLSCNRARTTAKNRRRYKIETDWVALSHLNYTEIMGKTDKRTA